MTMRSLFDGALTMILYVLAFAAGTVFVRANYDLIEAHPLLVFFVGAVLAHQLYNLIPPIVVTINDRLLGVPDR
ncbi:hypothetical protein [Novosphingobium sp. EMRT-2]|uniref:hypothetical protein n=1 Tax=Novosphingobium sp. EMRT-2 TaxID=2571749 RepID=UPI0010BD34C4|nr:hypothetical protein [Novosphingobium sp. EMRT-2]QCI95573.1 hypothetical protein FA702_17940 [Novosphingobium sp. EMRT-2]